MLSDDFNRANVDLKSSHNTSTYGTSHRNSYQIDEKRFASDSLPVEKHPLPLNYIVRLVETFADADSVNYIFPFLPGKTLYWVLQNQYNMKLAQDKERWWIKFYAAQVLCAIETMQRYNIIYRDIKPENMMIDGEGFLKVVDFGFAKILQPQNGFRTSTNCGTVGYTAPEVLLASGDGYSFQADIWSFGILLCELISG